MYPEPLYWSILGHCRNVSWANVRMYPEPLYRCILSHCTDVSWAIVQMYPEPLYECILSQCTDESWANVRMNPEPMYECILSHCTDVSWTIALLYHELYTYFWLVIKKHSYLKWPIVTIWFPACLRVLQLSVCQFTLTMTFCSWPSTRICVTLNSLHWDANDNHMDKYYLNIHNILRDLKNCVWNHIFFIFSILVHESYIL